MREPKLPEPADIVELCRRMRAINAAPDLESIEKAVIHARELFEDLARGLEAIEITTRRLREEGYTRPEELVS